MSTEWIIPVALGLGLSASAGFRVFVPLLVAAVAAKSGIIPLNQSFAWMAAWPAIICFGTATVLEILAYYIPFFDNLLDAVNAPLAIAGGTLLATSVLPADNELLKWTIGLIMGGGTAGIIHAGTSFLRLASTKTTAGAGNAIVSTGEHVAAFSLSISSLFIPVAVAVIILALIFLVINKLISSQKK
jgi:Domain of unknown function (DUF4126)